MVSALAAAQVRAHNAGSSEEGGRVLEVGSSLRRSREAQGLSLADAEKATRVRSRYLRALEEERFEELPGGAYPRVFLREYATFLGLEPDLLLESVPSAEPDIAPRPEPSPIRPLPWRRAVLAGLAIAAVGAIVFWVAAPGGHRRPAPAAGAAAGAVVTSRPVAVKHVFRHNAVARVAVLRAARGDCWILARRGATVVWRGTLRRGHMLRLPVSQRLWLRLGAPWNLQVLVAGKATAPLPHAPVNVWLSRRGLVPA
jgi:transcriptional regulator with XRE-family HTH domain